MPLSVRTGAGAGYAEAAGKGSRCDTPTEVFAEAPKPSGRPVAVHDVLDQDRKPTRKP